MIFCFCCLTNIFGFWNDIKFSWYFSFKHHFPVVLFFSVCCFIVWLQVLRRLYWDKIITYCWRSSESFKVRDTVQSANGAELFFDILESTSIFLVF